MSFSQAPAVNDIGADISKADFAVAINDLMVDVKKLVVKKFPRTAEGAGKFLEWAHKQLGADATIRVIMEATGLYSEQLADWLCGLNPKVRVVIANPRAVSDYAKSHSDTKTDDSDARVLARFGMGRSLIEYVPLPDEQKPLRAMVRCRKEIVIRITAEKQRRKEYEGLSEEVTQCQDRIIAQLGKEKITIDCAIKQFINKHSKLKKTVHDLKQICGVGQTVAAVIVAELGDLSRFKSHKAFAAFLGLKPREYSSGTSVKKRTRMSKRGSSYIRALLYMAAMAAVKQPNNRFAIQYEALVARGMVRMAALGAVMRKMAVVMRAMAVSNTPYQDDHKPTCGKPVESCGENTNPINLQP